MRIALCAAVAACLAVVEVPRAGALPVLPVDQATREKPLLEMRERLAAAVQRKDLAVLAEFVAPDARIAGAAGGPGALTAWLRREPALWDELARTLALGGRLIGRDRFDAPYTQFAKQKGVPADDLGVVTGRNVAVYDGPTEKARLMARYSVETVVVKRWWVAESHSDAARAAQPAEPWIEIELPSKRRGYMAKRSVRWVGAMRVTFAKRGARWWVTAIETGL